MSGLCRISWITSHIAVIQTCSCTSCKSYASLAKGDREDQLFSKRKDRVPSAKANLSNSLKKSSSARHQEPSSLLPKALNHYETDPSLLAKLKPTKVALEKERLYEDALSLKIEMNRLREENVRLKTRMQQMEKERESDDSKGRSSKPPSSPNLISNLKYSIKSLKAELLSKDTELLLLRKNLKSTKVAEQEIEIQAYIDECTRLRHHLEEIMNIGRTPAIAVFEEKIREMEKTEETKENEISDLKAALQAAQSELQKWRERMVSPRKRQKRKVDVKPDMHHKSKPQIDSKEKRKSAGPKTADVSPKRKDGSEKTTKVARSSEMSPDTGRSAPVEEAEKETKPRDLYSAKIKSVQLLEGNETPEAASQMLDFFFFKLSRLLVERKLSLAVLLSYIYRNDTGACTIAEMLNGMQSQGIEVSREEVEIVAKACGDSGKIMSEKLQTAFRRFEASKLSLSGGEESSPSSTPHAQDQPSHPIEPVSLKLPMMSEKRKEAPSPVFLSPEIPKITLEQAKPLLRHFSYRLQLQRIPKSKMFTVLFGSLMDTEVILNLKELVDDLKKPPMGFTDGEEAGMLARFLMEPEAPPTTIKESEVKELKSPAKDIVARLSIHLPDWPVFTPDLEAKFDAQISTAFQRNKLAIKESCKSYDIMSTGMITLAELMDIFNNLEMKLGQDVIHYMSLLFYSHKQELDQVPYKEFIAAYTEDPSSTPYNQRAGSEPMQKKLGELAHEEEEDFENEEQAEDEPELSETERARIVRFYLERIANYLKERDMRPVELFDIEAGYIYPEGLIKGLRRVPNIDMDQKDAIIFLEGLQAEEMDELCIAKDYLVQLLAHYGVPLGRSPRGTIAQNIITRSQDQQPHEKRVSLLDGDEELAENTPKPSVSSRTEVLTSSELLISLTKFGVRIANMLKMQGKTLQEWFGNKESLSLFEFLAVSQEVTSGSDEISELERLFKTLRKEEKLGIGEFAEAIKGYLKETGERKSEESSKEYDSDYESDEQEKRDSGSKVSNHTEIIEEQQLE